MNYKNHVLLFNIFFLLLLVVVTFVYPHINALNIQGYRAVNILSDVQSNNNAKMDSIASFKNVKLEITKGEIIIKDHNTDSCLVNAAGDKYALATFLHLLSQQQQHKNKKIRIAYFGDSFIEGDLITHDLRAMLQNNFGGDGVGFMPVTSISAGSRTSITQIFSKDWNDINFKSDEKATENLFLSGHIYQAAQGSWVSFRAVKEAHLDSFASVQILFGASKVNEATLNLNVNGQAHILQPTQLFNSHYIAVAKTNVVKISTQNATVPIYGFAFESTTGIFVDNFSFRGITGIELDNLKPDFLQQVQKKHPYDLLIIHYGPNLLFKPNLVEFSWYKKKMELVLKKIRSAFPETSILLVSTADKGARYNGEWMSEKGVLPLIETQYDMARKNGIDFFNLYNGMGGNNSMVDWVEQQPSLANKDYTHVNARGAKKIATILYNAIIKELNDYKKFD